MLELDEGAFGRAEESLRDTLQYAERGDIDSVVRGRTAEVLGLALHRQRKFAEAETALLESLRLGKEGGDTPDSLATTQELLDEVLEAQRNAGESS